MKKKVLILDPHPDDSILAMGATIARFHQVYDFHAVCFSLCEESIPAEFTELDLFFEYNQAMKLLGVKELRMRSYKVRNFDKERQSILEDMVRFREQTDYDLVCCPWSGDKHQDHQVIYNEATRAFKETSIIGYELPWNGVMPRRFKIKVSSAEIEKKTDALLEFKTQSARGYLSKLYTLARARGFDGGYYEYFEPINIVL